MDRTEENSIASLTRALSMLAGLEKLERGGVTHALCKATAKENKYNEAMDAMGKIGVDPDEARERINKIASFPAHVALSADETMIYAADISSRDCITPIKLDPDDAKDIIKGILAEAEKRQSTRVYKHGVMFIVNH